MLGTIDKAQYAKTRDGRELRLKGRSFTPGDPLRPDQDAIRFVNDKRTGYFWQLVNVVEPGTYAAKARDAKAQDERKRHPPLRVGAP